MGHRGTPVSVGSTADSSHRSPRGRSGGSVRRCVAGLPPWGGSEKPRHPSGAWEARHPQPATGPGDNCRDRVDDTREPCAQLGDISVELAPVATPNTALTCGNTPPPSVEPKNLAGCPFTGRSSGGRPVDMSTKTRSGPCRELIHTVIHRCAGLVHPRPAAGGCPLP